MADHPLVTEIYYDGAWHRANVYTRDQVTINRGQQNEQAEPAPSYALATLAGTDYNPRNPLSPLYGLAGRNTPARMYLGAPNMLGAADDGPGSTTSQVAPSIDAPAAGLLLCVWAESDTSATYTAPAGMTAGVTGDASTMTIFGARQIVAAGATGTRTATSSAARQYLSASIFIQGPAEFAGTGTVAPNGTGWFLDVVDPGDVWVVFSVFCSAGTGSTVEPTTDPPAVPAYPSDTDGGGWVLLADTGLIDLFNNGTEWARLKGWAKRCRTVDNAHRITLPGANPSTTVSWVTRVPAADIEGNWDIRMSGEIASWQPDRTVEYDPDAGRGDAWSKVEIAGPLRRLEQGVQPAHSALRRAILAQRPAGYWPMEDDRDATRFASGLVGAQPLTITTVGGVELAADDSLPGSRPLPRTARTINTGNNLRARGPVNGLGEEFTLRWNTRLPDLGATDELNGASVGVLFATGDVAILVTTYAFDPVSGDDIWIVAYEDFAGNTTVLINTTITHVNAWRDVRMVVDGSGSGIAVSLYIDGSLVDSGSTGSDSIGPPNGVNLAFGSNGPERAPVTVGHLAIWDGVVDPDLADAAAGFSGERVAYRFLRLCQEAGISASVLGDPDATPPMGVQQPDTTTNLLAEVARTGAGKVFESPASPVAVYRTVDTLYNQTPRLTLNWAAGQVSPPLQPIVDDYAVRNDITAKRPGGSSYRVEQTAGALNVHGPGDDPQGVGRYQAEISVNPQTDDGLRQIAGWNLGLGTVDEPRFAQVTVDLDAHPDLADEVSAVIPGDLIVITNVPKTLAPRDIRLIVLGHAPEMIATDRRKVTFNCAPAAPYNVFTWGESRWVSKRTFTPSPITETQTSITLVSVGKPWTTRAEDFPMRVEINGEEWEVTAIGAATQSGDQYTQDWTVTRAANGVQKAHPVGSVVQIVEPARYAL